MVVTNPAAAGAHEVTQQTLERAWQEAAAQQEAAALSQTEDIPSQPLPPVDSMQLEVVYVRTEAEACRVLDRELGQLR